MADLQAPLFGSVSAENDDLLLTCYIRPPGTVAGKPLVVGRWGTGKTGHILYTYRGLSEQLKKVSADLERLWYFDENAIDISLISYVFDEYGNNIHSLKRKLEEIWDAEITRRHIEILYALREYYRADDSEPWKKIRKLASTGKAIRSLLKVGIGLATVVRGADAGGALKDLLSDINSLIEPSVKQAVNSCIANLPPHCQRPIVAIEPIETPNSALEGKPELADLVITCLLNVFQQKYQISSNQHMRLVVSIPWHRYDRKSVSQPQKLADSYGEFSWNKNALRSYINRRIEHEYNTNSTRTIYLRGREDYWSKLFPKFVTNRSCGGVKEDTFDYILRHTHYRVRDLLRFVQRIIEAEIERYEIDRVAFFRDNYDVSEATIRTVVRKVSIETSDERIIEGVRRFPGVEAVVNSIYGLSVPFTLDDLKRRCLDLISDTNNIIHIRDRLWHCGIIGLQIAAVNQDAANHLRNRLGEDAAEKSKEIGRFPLHFYAFAHTSGELGLTNLLSMFDNGDDRNITRKYVLHPMMFEKLDARLSGGYPIGC